MVLGAPLAIDADAFKTAGGDSGSVAAIDLRESAAYGDVPVGKGTVT